MGTEPEVRPAADLDTVAGLLGTLAGQSVTLDVEHSGYPIGHPAYVLRTIQLGTDAFAVVLDASDRAHLGLAARVLEDASEIVAHASQADVIPVALACGLDPAPWFAKVTDTAVLGALADPHLTGTDRGHALDLKGLAARLVAEPVSDPADKARAVYFRKSKWLTNTEPTTDPARSGWAQADYSEPVMARYAASDVLDTAALRRVLPDVQPELLERERRVLATTARIAETGLLLDGDWITKRQLDAERERTTLRAALASMGADEPGSTAQLGARFAELGADLPRTPTGKPSTAEAALEDLARHDGEAATLARTVLDWREQDKLLGTYLEPYALLVDRGDGRVRPTVQTLGAAATGRMSVVRPNLQQVPKVGGIRGCVIADPGHLLIGADFASVEIRVAAALSGDTELAGMIRDGLDMHGRIAALVFGPGYTKTQRYAIKRVVFGKMYGSGKANLARQLGVDGHRVDDVIDAMEQITPGFVQWAARLQSEVRQGLRPVWRHPSGRLTYLPQDTPHKAPNYAIQSTARELLVDALERWESIRPGHVLLPIHDEIVVQVPEAEAEQATLDLVACMTTDLAGVPIAAEASTPSARWADAS
jgi:DNA polymerase I-like protein with 3'-5' exonuclease and polymerase domains